MDQVLLLLKPYTILLDLHRYVPFGLEYILHLLHQSLVSKYISRQFNKIFTFSEPIENPIYIHTSIDIHHPIDFDYSASFLHLECLHNTILQQLFDQFLLFLVFMVYFDLLFHLLDFLFLFSNFPFNGVLLLSHMNSQLLYLIILIIILF